MSRLSSSNLSLHSSLLTPSALIAPPYPSLCSRLNPHNPRVLRIFFPRLRPDPHTFLPPHSPHHFIRLQLGPCELGLQGSPVHLRVVLLRVPPPRVPSGGGVFEYPADVLRLRGRGGRLEDQEAHPVTHLAVEQVQERDKGVVRAL